MKRIILPVLIVSMTMAANAQEIPERKPGTPGMHHKMDRQRGHRMDMQQLNLTEEQKAQFKTQRENFRQQMEALKKNDNITVKEWKAKMETLRKENKAKTESILTAEQKAKIEQLKKEKMQQRKEMAEKRGEKMQSYLGLTEAQSAQLKKNREATRQKMKAIKEDSKLSEEQKKEQVKALLKEQRENMKSVLTEEQIRKMKETQHRKPGGREGDRKRTAPKETI